MIIGKFFFVVGGLGLVVGDGEDKRRVSWGKGDGGFSLNILVFICYLYFCLYLDRVFYSNEEFYWSFKFFFWGVCRIWFFGV